MNTIRYGLTIDPVTAIKLDDPDVGFSLECFNCDAGMDVDSFEQAIILGWEDIQFDDGLAWNYLGLCPECVISEAAR